MFTKLLAYQYCSKIPSPVDIQVEEISDFNFPVLGAGQGHADRLHLLLAAVHSVLELQNIEIFVSAQHLNTIICYSYTGDLHQPATSHPFLVVVKPQTGVLDLLHSLLLLLLPLGEFGHDLPHGRDGESVAFGHLGIFSL